MKWKENISSILSYSFGLMLFGAGAFVTKSLLVEFYYIGMLIGRLLFEVLSEQLLTVVRACAYMFCMFVLLVFILIGIYFTWYLADFLLPEIEDKE